MSRDIARLYSAELDGIDARLIEVEVDINIGLHAFNIVGLADKALNEAKERVNAALKNSGIKPPNQENRRVTVNLAPADVKKTGSQYDLAIAVGYLLATGQIKKFDPREKLFLGELALDGGLRPISGSLCIAQMAKTFGFKKIFISTANANEAAAIPDIDILPVANLIELIGALEERCVIVPKIFTPKTDSGFNFPDFSEIKGQGNIKRAITIAACGGHNILMIGPPGVGKSFLAQALGGVLPELSLDESIELTKIWSAAGFRLGGLMRRRPFRAPHHTASGAALIGGGQDPRPGEISLAHRGILFLDELPEFSKGILESLRQPMEAGVVHIARARRSFIFPAKFSLVAAMNPCPCGYYGDPELPCKCSPYEVIKYQKRISGPLLDRIDIQVRVGRVKIEDLQRARSETPTSPSIKQEIESARTLQLARLNKVSLSLNSEMGSRDIEKFIPLDLSSKQFLGGLEKNHLSPRSYYRILKVARTIADLAGKKDVSTEDIAEAYSYRLRDEMF